MNYIESVNIEGFWGSKKVSFGFHDDVNFLIGINGSGKTTAINLLVSALKCDYRSLIKAQFVKISIKLKQPKGRKKPIIEVIKKGENNNRFSDIEYRIQDSTSETPLVYSLDTIGGRPGLLHLPKHILQRELQRIHGNNVSEHLEKLVKVSWLSVHRAGPSADSERNLRGSAVDRKLQELSNRLVRYFSSLNKQGSLVLENFQQVVFLSMLIGKKQNSLFTQTGDIDLKEEKNALNMIFKQFNLAEDIYKERVKNHFDILKKAREKLSQKDNLDTMDIASLVSTERIDYIVQEWGKVTEKRKRIFRPRETFLGILNDLMQRKKFSINESNELTVSTDTIGNLHLHNLSSGEKQLLIVLGEALVQEGSTWVYIADEPELSLHVNWQESLVDNLRAINPNAQIIFATHSPDIVSSYGKKVFDMEAHIK